VKYQPGDSSSDEEDNFNVNDNNDGLLKTAVAAAAAAVSAVVTSSASGPQPQKSQRQLKRRQSSRRLKNMNNDTSNHSDINHDKYMHQQLRRKNLDGHEIILHALSPKMAHGKIINWLKVEGEEVRRHDIVAIISGNDCGMKYISSPMDGIVAVLKAQEGDTVQVGSVLTLVGGDDYEVKRMQLKAKDMQLAGLWDQLRRNTSSFDDS